MPGVVRRRRRSEEPKEKPPEPSEELKRLARSVKATFLGADPFGGSLDIKLWFSTGSTLLDMALGGGIPAQRVTEIHGPPSSGKTVIAAEILGSCQRQGGVAVIIDPENTFEAERAKLFGLDVNQALYYSAFNTVEEVFECVFEVAKKHAELYKGDTPPPITFAIDSIAALSTKTEMDASLSDASYGMTVAKKMSEALRKLPRLLAQANATLVCLNQVRQNIGGYGSAFVTPGGTAIGFYASCRVLLLQRKKIEDARKVVTGVTITARVVKNKVARPFLEVEFPFYFDYGIDDVGSMAMWLADNVPLTFGNDKKGSSWYDVSRLSPELRSKPKIQGMLKLIRFFEEHNLERLLVEVARREWRKFYDVDPRKRKQRFDG